MVKRYLNLQQRLKVYEALKAKRQEFFDHKTSVTQATEIVRKMFDFPICEFSVRALAKEGNLVWWNTDRGRKKERSTDDSLLSRIVELETQIKMVFHDFGPLPSFYRELSEWHAELRNRFKLLAKDNDELRERLAALEDSATMPTSKGLPPSLAGIR